MSRHVPLEGEVTEEDKERFFAKTKRTTFFVKDKEDEKGCLVWTGAKVRSYWSPAGREKDYWQGKFSWNDRTVLTHRFALYMEMGVDPGPSVDHLCYNSLCVEPSHLYGGSHEENMANRRVITSFYCKRGHERNEQNVYWHKDGRRDCRECAKIRDAKRYKVRYEKFKSEQTNDSAPVAGKLTQEQVEQIRTRVAAGESIRSLAKEYKVSPPAIRYRLNKI